MQHLLSPITDFIFVSDHPTKADIILIPGGMRRELMERAIELYEQGFAPYLLPSGGVGPKLQKSIAEGNTKWKSEWEFMQAAALEHDIPTEAILKEDKALHTFDNANLSWQVIQEHGIEVSKAILICKAHHARRAVLTYATVFPTTVEFVVCPIVDERDVRPDNWYTDDEKIALVMSEVEKIGKYFGKHIPYLASHPDPVATGTMSSGGTFPIGLVGNKKSPV